MTNQSVQQISSHICKRDKTLSSFHANIVYQIYSKLGIEICLYMLFLCTKFQGNRVSISCFITFFEKFAKRIYAHGAPGSLLRRSHFSKICLLISWVCIRIISS